jgi:hypothetical protein
VLRHDDESTAEMVGPQTDDDPLVVHFSDALHAWAGANDESVASRRQRTTPVAQASLLNTGAAESSSSTRRADRPELGRTFRSHAEHRAPRSGLVGFLHDRPAFSIIRREAMFATSASASTR